MIDHDLATLQDTFEKYKDEYGKLMQSYLGLPYSNKRAKRDALLAFHSQATKVFNCMERLIPAGSLARADINSTWYTYVAESAGAVLDTIRKHFETVNKEVNKLGNMPAVAPSPAAFATMQRLIRDTNPSLAQQLRNDFCRAGLPTHGFDTEESQKVKGWEITVACFSGLALIVCILGLAVFIPYPSAWQISVFWTVLAISLAGFATVITGHIRIRGKTGRFEVRAGGAVAVFVLVYFMGPLALGRGLVPKLSQDANGNRASTSIPAEGK